MKITKNNIDQIIKDSQYIIYYQPIIKAKDNKTVGYEALSRFYIDNIKINTQKLFDTISNLPIKKLLKIEKNIISKQIEQAPYGKLFINIHPQIIAHSLENILELLDHNIVIELLENLYRVNRKKLKAAIERLTGNGINIAIDDFGKLSTFFSFTFLKNARYIKIDIEAFKLAKTNKNYYNFLKEFINYYHSIDKEIIIEGIETEKDLEVARKLNGDYIQGFLFNSNKTKAEHKIYND